MYIYIYMYMRYCWYLLVDHDTGSYGLSDAPKFRFLVPPSFHVAHRPRKGQGQPIAYL